MKDEKRTYSAEKLENLIIELEKGKDSVWCVTLKGNGMCFVYQQKGASVNYFLMGIDDGSGMKLKHLWKAGAEELPPDITILVKEDEKVAVKDAFGEIHTFGFKKSDSRVENLIILFKTETLGTIIAANKPTNKVDVLNFCSYEETDAICYCIESMMNAAENEERSANDEQA